MIRIDSVVTRIDSIVIRIDSVVLRSTRFAPRSTRLSAQLTRSKKRLDAKPLTRLCARFHSIFTDSTLLESILQQSSLVLQQSSRFTHANHSHTRHLTTPTGHAQKCSQQSRLVYKLICFTPHLRQPTVALKAGRQKQENQNHDWHEACFANCVTAHAKWVWSSGVYGYGWRERIDSIAEGPTRLLKD